ncbi:MULTISPECIES: response regulator transcription factor [unclassified Nostoc]|uniref:response regulator transcription factor n=1 Tax=unclassified Nostoc TaxID=2593658 RepID=UPI0025AA5D53|nr:MULTISPECIES: response regulator transcription factor [unclassified Nostoc]MDM9584445.1 response regulator transcription factor [Nostoc sp. GT001]MDZ7946412.1 response regulator transcription factor [Nostoc sp. EfeVER01]MDZ7993079.1 response regulator transcription factor [Nostoc sp. EspVER01]
MKRILIAEDESRIASFLQKGFKANGFTTYVVEDGEKAIVMANSNNFDLLILDIGLPEKDGWTVLEELRGQGQQLPIIILTVHDNVKDKVNGFERGADDYVTKPFRFEELLARVRARLRDRHSPNGEDEMILSTGNVVFDLRTRKVKVGDRIIELSAREFTLTETFLRHPGQVLSREQLLSHVWGYDHDPGNNIVDVYVGYLRKKLGNKFIETVRGMGYRLGL